MLPSCVSSCDGPYLQATRMALWAWKCCPSTCMVTSVRMFLLRRRLKLSRTSPAWRVNWMQPSVCVAMLSQSEQEEKNITAYYLWLTVRYTVCIMGRQITIVASIRAYLNHVFSMLCSTTRNSIKIKVLLNTNSFNWHSMFHHFMLSSNAVFSASSQNQLWSKQMSCLCFLTRRRHCKEKQKGGGSLPYLTCHCARSVLLNRQWSICQDMFWINRMIFLQWIN